MLDKEKFYSTYIYYTTKHLSGKVKLPAMRNMKSKFKKEGDVLSYVAISAAISYLEVQNGDNS